MLPLASEGQYSLEVIQWEALHRALKVYYSSKNVISWLFCNVMIPCRRRKQKKDLHKFHIEEAKKLGVGVDSVPHIVVPAYEELDKDLKLLAMQQVRRSASFQPLD